MGAALPYLPTTVTHLHGVLPITSLVHINSLLIWMLAVMTKQYSSLVTDVLAWLMQRTGGIAGNSRNTDLSNPTSVQQLSSVSLECSSHITRPHGCHFVILTNSNTLQQDVYNKYHKNRRSSWTNWQTTGRNPILEKLIVAFYGT
jgi:hypothetical protein